MKEELKTKHYVDKVKLIPVARVVEILREMDLETLDGYNDLYDANTIASAITKITSEEV